MRRRLTNAELEPLALEVREHIVHMAARGGCFIGAWLSCVDILVSLYGRVMNISPSLIGQPERDYLFLSKGHDVPALYGTLAELDYFPRERLARHLDPSDAIYWHPNRSIPGVEFHSGSLGHCSAWRSAWRSTSSSPEGRTAEARTPKYRT